jgi:hypothetical protein
VIIFGSAMFLLANLGITEYIIQFVRNKSSYITKN